MGSTTQQFDARLLAFKELQNAPWGRLRYHIAVANLQRHLNGQPLCFLDVGGGNGREAIAFAAHGHTVALLDFSAEMIADAHRNAELSGVTERITFHQADFSAIPTLFPEACFDVVLCHNVVQFVDDLPTLLHATSHALRVNGLISVMGTNRYSEAYRQALQQLDLATAYASLAVTTTYSPTFDMPIHLHTAEEVRQVLQEVGCVLEAHYGVRCLVDYLGNNDLKHDPTFFAQLERLEYAMSDQYPYYLLARLFQLIGRKTSQ